MSRAAAGPEGHVRRARRRRARARRARGRPRAASSSAPATSASRRPTFEATELFARGVGESTDVVQKEMYTFDDGGGRSLTLRPEGTAPVCRAYIEHGMHKRPQPVKLWYLSSFFRRERPQAGPLPPVLADRRGGDRLRRPGRRRRADPPARRAARGARRARAAAAARERSARRRRAPPTARSCRPTCARTRTELSRRGARAHRPQPAARLRRRPPRHARGDGGRAAAARPPRRRGRASTSPRSRALLDAAGVAYEVDPTLVRGLDYYTRTVFEFTSDALGAQSRRRRRRALRRARRAARRRRRRPAWAGRRASSGSCSPRRAPPVAPPPLDLYVAYAGPEHARRGLPARRRRAPGRPRGAARARRALAEGPAQAGRPGRRPLRCDPGRRRASRSRTWRSGEQQTVEAETGHAPHPRGDRCEAAARQRATATAGPASCARGATSARAVRVAGWVHRRRDHGGLIFIDLRDRSGLVQLVFHPETAAEAFALAETLRSEHVRHASPARSSRREAGNVNPNLAHRRDRARRRRAPSGWPRPTTPPFPVDEDGAGRRDAAPAPPRPRPAPRADAHAMTAAPHGHPRDARLPRRARLPRDRDADPHPLDARGRARLPRARRG